MGWFALINFAISAVFAYFMLAKMYNWKTDSASSQSENDRQLVIPPGKGTALREIYIKFYKELNVKAAANALSDLFYHTVLSDIQLLRKFAIRREIYFTPAQLENAADASHITASDGNLMFTDTSTIGEYWEQFVDTTTEQPLLRRHYKTAVCTTSFNRNPYRLTGETVFCDGCDTPLNMDGEFFKCPACGSTYTADSYTWTASNISFNECDVAGSIVQRDLGTGKRTGIQKIATINTVLLFGTIILAFIFSSVPFIRVWTVAYSILWDIFLVAIVLLMVARRNRSKALMHFDPNCNPQRVADRAAYLVNKTYMAGELNPEQIRPFMDEEYYRYWRSSLQYPEDRIINIKPSHYDDVVNKFWTDEQRQYVRVRSTFVMMTINSRKELKERLDYIDVVMYRNIGARYQNARSAEIIRCPNCGSFINATADARCKYCNTGYDVADFDWKLLSLTPIKPNAFSLLIE